MQHAPFRKPPLGARLNTFKQPKPLPAIPTPDPDRPFPALDALPVIKYEENKSPEESGVKLKASAKDKPKNIEKTFEEEQLEKKLSELEDLRAYLDKFEESWKKLVGDDWGRLSDEVRWESLDKDEGWDLRQKLIRAASLVAENESEAFEKQGDRVNSLWGFIPAASPVSPRILEMFKDKLGMFIDKTKHDLKNMRQDGVDYIAA